MTQTLINLALPVVSERIDQRLAADPTLTYHRALSNCDLHHKLEAYVMSRLPSRYVSLEASQVCSLESPSQCYSSQQLRQIDDLVEQGLMGLIARPVQLSSPQEPSAPSSWFG
ncbi:hypothetical protein C7271_10090 [filamentous cyanobacterium CCP5]|nr:hypothetical protein C7271_10090 [filamentous cyanobacterium CCP5]